MKLIASRDELRKRRIGALNQSDDRINLSAGAALYGISGISLDHFKLLGGRG
jgi:hypothetical protein